MTLVALRGRRLPATARARPVVVVCIGCGCDDLHACDDGLGGSCYWIVVNHKTHRGVCSECAHRMLQALVNG